MYRRTGLIEPFTRDGKKGRANARGRDRGEIIRGDKPTPGGRTLSQATLECRQTKFRYRTKGTATKVSPAGPRDKNSTLDLDCSEHFWIEIANETMQRHAMDRGVQIGETFHARKKSPKGASAGQIKQV